MDIKNILQVLPKLELGGVERGVVEISRLLVQDGHKSYVVCSGGSLVTQLRKDGGVPLIIPSIKSKAPWNIIINIFRLVRLIRRHNINIVHARSRAPAWSAFWAARICKVPFITTFHGTYSLGNNWLTYWLKQRYNSIMARGEVVIAPSQYIKRHIMQHYSDYQPPIVVIPRGVDCDYFNPDNIDSEEVIAARLRYGIAPNQTVIMLPGRLSWWKGHHILLEALVQLRDIKNLLCCFVGIDTTQQSNYYRMITKIIDEYKIAPQILMLPPASEMNLMYTLSDLVISPSIIPEAFGRVIAEAQAMRKIVIASRHGGAAEIIEEGKTGWLYDNNNPDLLALKIRRFLEMNPEERQVMGECARQRVLNNFTLRNMYTHTRESAYIAKAV